MQPGKPEGLSITMTVLSVLVILKAAGIIQWSWWIVMSPLLIPVGVTIAVLIVWVCAVGSEKMIKSIKEKFFK